MRKFLFISLCITILCLFCSLPVNAQELNRKIGEGYTAEGIHYTVYEAETTQNHTRSVEPSIYVSRYFVFDSTYFPPQKIKHHFFFRSMAACSFLSIMEFTSSSLINLVVFTT